ncbi:LysR family transcriptional regulator [Burkholderia sp. MR1-5-21]
MVDLDDMRMIRALGASRSLSAAARLLYLTPPAVTVRLQRLEERLGVRLAVRDTRNMTLTDEGQCLLQEAEELLERIEAIPSRISNDQGAISGSLRIVAPFGFGRTYVAPIIRDIHRNHPKLQVALYLSDSPVAAASSADVVINIGSTEASAWVGHYLAPNERLLCASPSSARRINLSHPSELRQYQCLRLRESDDDMPRWRFTEARADDDRPSRTVTVPVAGLLSSNDVTVISDWATNGIGIMERSEWDAAPLISAGKLIRLLPDWRLAPAPVMAFVPGSRDVSIRQRLFLDAAKRALHPPPWRR